MSLKQLFLPFLALVLFSCNQAEMRKRAAAKNPTWLFKTTENENGPQTDIYVVVGDTLHVAEGIGQFKMLDKAGRAEQKIPAQAHTSCQGFWAGLDQKYALFDSAGCWVVKGLFTDAEAEAPSTWENVAILQGDKKTGKWSTAWLAPEPEPIKEVDYSGTYTSVDKGCGMTVNLEKSGTGYRYAFQLGKRKQTGVAEVNTSDRTYMLFKGLYAAEPKEEVEAAFDEGSLIFQNSGNAMNPYTLFKECDLKYIHLAKKGQKPAMHSKSDDAPKTVPSETAESKTTKGSGSKTKPAAAKSTTPAVTLNQNGEITLNGKKCSLENLKKDLQASLLAGGPIPDKIEFKKIGQTGMGMRGEVETTIDEALSGAKWLRKKSALATLNAPVGKKLGLETQLQVNAYTTSGAYAFIDARPMTAEGNGIDYSATPLKKEALSKSFNDGTFGLLRYEKGKWKILEYNIGQSKAPASAWMKKYGAPKALFAKQ